MSVEFGAFVPLSFDARRQDDAERAGVARRQIMHLRCIWAVGAEDERFWWSCSREKSIKHGPPFAMWVNWHGDEDCFPKQKLSNESVPGDFVLCGGVTGTLPHEFLALIDLQMFDGSGRDNFFNICRI